MTLTLEQVKDGRKLWGAAAGGSFPFEREPALGDWFEQHAEALLDAAERVARQEAEHAAACADVQRAVDLEFGSERAEREAGRMAERKKAGQRIEDLREAFQNTFAFRPVVPDNQSTTNREAFHPRDVVDWFLTHGVHVSVYLDPSNPSRLQVDPIRLA